MPHCIEGIQVQERQVGRQWLITSDDLPGLYVANRDRDVARKAVLGAIRMLREMAQRRSDKAYAGA